MTKILVAGASGYLGQRLCKILSNRFIVVALVRKKILIEGAASTEVVEDLSRLREVIKKIKPDIIINAIANYGRNESTLYDLLIPHVLYSYQLYQLADQNNVSCYINFGTALPPECNAYSATKVAFVDLVKSDQKNQCRFVNFSLEHFFGEFDHSSKFTGMLFARLLSGEPLDLTEGRQTRDFIYVDDVVSAVECVIKNIISFERFQEFGLGSGRLIEVREFVLKAKQAFNSDSILNFGVIPTRENELDGVAADTKKLNALGWQPSVGYEAALNKIAFCMLQEGNCVK